MEVTKVGVIGAGIMGAGIAQVAAAAGLAVILRDIENGLVQKGLATLGRNLQRAVEKGKLRQEAAADILSRVTGTVDMGEAVADADIVIEAIVEKIDVKKAVFKELDSVCPARTILASNTSGLSITDMAAATGRPDKVVGMHFFNPVPVMKLVELIRGFVTSEETMTTCRQLAASFNKTAVEVNEAPGFAVNRILCPMMNEAIVLFSEGVASAEDIDKAMMLGANHPIGPLALADMVGLDTLLHVMEGLQQELGDDKYRPAPVLRKMVRAGFLGRKTAKGFFEYR